MFRDLLCYGVRGPEKEARILRGSCPECKPNGLPAQRTGRARTKVQTSVMETDRERIVELFARRQPTYGRCDVMRLLGLSEEQFAEHLARGVLTTEVDEDGLRVVPWEDVATLAL